MSNVHEWNTVLLSGYAKLPTSTTVEAAYHILVVAVLFDKRTGVIVEAEASMVTDLTKRFITRLLVGYNLNDGPDDPMEVFENYYYGNTKKALETALRSVFIKYKDYVAEQHQFL